MMLRKFLLLIFLGLFFGCSLSTQNVGVKENELKEIPLKYAVHLKIYSTDCGDYFVKIRNPWDTLKTLHSYFITDNDTSIAGVSVLKRPIEKSLIFTSLHASLIKNLGCVDKISSLCDVQYVLDKDLLERVEDGKIKDLGSSMTPDAERIILENPDVILLSPYESSNGFGVLSKTKIPLVECADYMENSPLGQAEWIKFYGIIFDKVGTADSIFRVVENNYLQLKQLVENSSTKPILLANSLTGSVWYMPTIKSTSGRFYCDAGFSYPFDNLEGFGTVPLDFEAVFSKASNAEKWIFKYNRNEDYTLETFSKEHANYKDFNAMQKGEVYGCNLQVVPFYDQTPFRPDLLLKDYIKISHPEILKDYKMRYFKKLE